MRVACGCTTAEIMWSLPPNNRSHKEAQKLQKVSKVFLCLLCLLVATSFPVALFAQGGASTGAPATYTSRRTAGIVDPNAPVVFEDVTDKTPLASFRHRSGDAAKDYIFE